MFQNEKSFLYYFKTIIKKFERALCASELFVIYSLCMQNYIQILRLTYIVDKTLILLFKNQNKGIAQTNPVKATSTDKLVRSHICTSVTLFSHNTYR